MLCDNLHEVGICVIPALTCSNTVEVGIPMKLTTDARIEQPHS